MIDLMYFSFNWDGVIVTRLAEHKGYRVLGIETPYATLQIQVTPTGRITVRPIVKKHASRSGLRLGVAEVAP